MCAGDTGRLQEREGRGEGGGSLQTCCVGEDVLCGGGEGGVIYRGVGT